MKKLFNRWEKHYQEGRKCLKKRVRNWYETSATERKEGFQSKAKIRGGRDRTRRWVLISKGKWLGKEWCKTKGEKKVGGLLVVNGGVGLCVGLLGEVWVFVWGFGVGFVGGFWVGGWGFLGGGLGGGVGRVFVEGGGGVGVGWVVVCVGVL